jgi:putative addiction module killer protein
MTPMSERQIELYVTEDDEIPYETWFDGLKDARTKHRIKARMARLRLGNFGQWNHVGEGVTELILDFGPGYRIYFAQVGVVVILLLCGGDKSTQISDIRAAREYLANYNVRKRKEITHVKAN